MSDTLLSVPQARIIGAMIEKQLTTPLNYPMTPNAVRVACNQKNNRDPVVEFDDDIVFDTLKSLERLGYIESGLFDNSQTIRYKQKLKAKHELERGEEVILCELFNRGSQTPGELRSRCDRMHKFPDLADVERCLQKLASRRFVVMLERQPGTKEPRWGHLLSGQPTQPTASAQRSTVPSNPALEERVAQLEELVAKLEKRIEALEG